MGDEYKSREEGDRFRDGSYRTKAEERLADEYGGPYRAGGGSTLTAVESGAGSTSSGMDSTSDRRYADEGFSSSSR